MKKGVNNSCMKNIIIHQDEFVTRWAKRARFAKKDIQIILDALIEEMTESVKKGETVKIKNFGRLNTQHIGKRTVKSYTDKSGKFHPEVIHPETTRTTFKLAEGIRTANKSKKDSL